MIARTVMLGLTLTLAGCASTPAALPPRADIAALTEAKPKPSAAILTDPTASDRHNSAIEGWGDRLHSAGLRLCRYFNETGMPGLDCPAPR